MNQRLIIFDIDGTLTDSMNLDDEIYRASLKQLFKIVLSDAEWYNLKQEATGVDSGILKSLCAKYSFSSDEEISLVAFKSVFMHNFKLCLSNDPDKIKETPGACSFIKRLRNAPNVAIGIATGSWRESGLQKLFSCGINIDGFAYGHAGISDERKHILNYVIKVASLAKNIHFDKIIYFGDGLWDYRAASAAGIEFIGIDIRNDGMLRSNGIENVLNSFEDYENVLKIIANI